LKVMASLVNGVRWGMGFRFERTCRPEDCQHRPACKGESTFHRACKLFDFIPHYKVKTRTAEGVFDGHGKVCGVIDFWMSD
jgi:hypothetical protein